MNIRKPEAKRFKIEYPLVGWSCFKRSRGACQEKPLPTLGRSRFAPTNLPSGPGDAFTRVDPHCLPVLDSRFVLEVLLGQGSFGKVFLAWDKDNEKKVALKLDLYR